MNLKELKAEIEVVKAKMVTASPYSIEYQELTTALVILQDMYINQASEIFKQAA